MLHFLPAPLLGILSSSMICFNTVFWFTLFIPFIVLKILPVRPLRVACSRILIGLAEAWVHCNSGILYLSYPVQWEIEGLEGLDPHQSYLVISNHQSWTDIFVLQHIFKRQIPFLKFFLKQELIWVPVLGLAWWALDFPFMKRYSRELLEKRPELKGKDMETTRKFCQRYKDYPVSVINFLEGSRFTPEKKKKRGSPYEHLLKPKAGGIALVYAVMGDVLHEVLDVTIVYPEGAPRKLFWALLSGRLERVHVKIRRLPVPDNVVGRDYLNDEAYRQEMQTWVNHLWGQKDAEIQAMRNAQKQDRAQDSEVLSV